MRAVALASLLSLAGCTFAHEHPAITSGIVGGVVGFSACEFDSAKHTTCVEIGAVTAAFLGGIFALVDLVAETNDHSIPPDNFDNERMFPLPPRHKTPSEAPADAGMPASGAAVDAGVPASGAAVDAGAPASGAAVDAGVPASGAAVDAGVPAADAAQ
jgi:hypothetical protein